MTTSDAPPVGRAGRNLPAAIGVGLGLGALVLGTLYSPARWTFVVVIAAASAHRAEAFAACRFAIERVKQIAPVWKHEHFEGGEVWIEGATADPDDEAALRTAAERACS